MSVCQNVPRFLPEHDRKLGIPNERKQKETHSIHKKQKYFRWYPRRNHYLRLLWHGSHLRQSALASPLAFRHSKNPPATHWAIFVSQECSATLLRDISARKRCPSAPSPNDHRKILDSLHHQGTAIPRFGESAVPCRIYSTLKSFRHTCRLLSIITVCPKFYLLWVKWSEPRKTLVCPYDLHQGFTDLISRQRMIMPSIIWILVYRLGCHPSLITMKNHAPATPQSLSSIFNQDVISRLLDKCVK